MFLKILILNFLNCRLSCISKAKFYLAFFCFSLVTSRLISYRVESEGVEIVSERTATAEVVGISGIFWGEQAIKLPKNASNEVKLTFFMVTDFLSNK